MSSHVLPLVLCLLTAMTQSLLRQITPASPPPPGADAIVGTWVSRAQDSKTDIVPVGDTYGGRLLAGWGNTLYEADGQTLRRDVRNPDPALRTRSLLGMLLLTGLRYENGAYTGGKLYDARLGKTFDCMARLRGSTLELRIYWRFSWLGTTKKWTRIAQ